MIFLDALIYYQNGKIDVEKINWFDGIFIFNNEKYIYINNTYKNENGTVYHLPVYTDQRYTGPVWSYACIRLTIYGSRILGIRTNGWKKFRPVYTGGKNI